MAMIPHIEVLTTKHRKTRDLASHASWSNNRFYATLEFKRATGELTFKLRDSYIGSDLSKGSWTLEIVRNGESAKYTIEIRYWSDGWVAYYEATPWGSMDYRDLGDVSELRLYLYKQ